MRAVSNSERMNPFEACIKKPRGFERDDQAFSSSPLFAKRVLI